MTPLPGDFGLVRMNGAAGRWIRIGQWLNGDGFADYEHAFVFAGAGQIVEAEPGGARCVPLHYDNVLWSTGLVDLNPAQRQSITVLARGCASVRTPYSFADYAALFAHRLHLPLPWLKTYVASSGHMICSQLVDWCYTQAGARLFDDGRWPGYVTPGDLYQLLRRTP